MKHIRFYYLGDSWGAFAEGGAGGSVSYEKALKGIRAFPRGTDESDTARLFLRYCDEVGPEQFSVTGWYAYHTKHRAATSYGKTWNDHFLTVEAILEKRGELDYDHLIQLSVDRESNGNGCLALAYPIAMLFPGRACQLADSITAGTHYLARPTMQLAVQYFLGKKTLEEVRCQAFPGNQVDALKLTPLAHACLWAAATIAQEKTLKEVIKKALLMGGDVDSFLASGLLMWGVEKNLINSSL